IPLGHRVHGRLRRPGLGCLDLEPAHTGRRRCIARAMSALATLETGLLLGLYVLLAGIWGVLWALARFRATPIFRRLAGATYGLHSLGALVIFLWTPLGFGWKCLIVGSSLFFLAIPPMTWRLLQRTHADEGSEHDREPAERSGRIVARL